MTKEKEGLLPNTEKIAPLKKNKTKSHSIQILIGVEGNIDYISPQGTKYCPIEAKDIIYSFYVKSVLKDSTMKIFILTMHTECQTFGI